MLVLAFHYKMHLETEFKPIKYACFKMKLGVVMLTFFTVLQVVVALLLICVVLIQEPKSTGGGLFSGTGQSLLGTSGKTFWTKFTTTLAVVFFALCLGLAALPKSRQPGSSIADEIQRRQQETAAAVTQAAPKADGPAASKAPAAGVPAPAAAPSGAKKP
jgi:preprotein translocase subunit SecG